MRISDWSSDVCSSDLLFAGMESLRRSVGHRTGGGRVHGQAAFGRGERGMATKPGSASTRPSQARIAGKPSSGTPPSGRSEEHTSELQSLMRISYAVFCLKTKKETDVS